MREIENRHRIARVGSVARYLLIVVRLEVVNVVYVHYIRAVDPICYFESKAIGNAVRVALLKASLLGLVER